MIRYGEVGGSNYNANNQNYIDNTQAKESAKEKRCAHEEGILVQRPDDYEAKRNIRVANVQE